jgi:acyl-CoA reductase-like NAD-dependent aldehyde dehydrogenase
MKPFKHIEDVLPLLDNSGYNLALGLFSKSHDEIMYVTEKARTGMVLFYFF